MLHQVKRSTNSAGEVEDSMMLLRMPLQKLPRTPGCDLYYSEAVHGIPLPFAKLVGTEQNTTPSYT